MWTESRPIASRSPDGVLRHLTNAIPGRGELDCPNAAIVKGDQAICRGEQGDKLAPVRVVASEARNQQQRLTGPAFFVIYVDSVCSDLGYTLRAIGSRCLFSPANASNSGEKEQTMNSAEDATRCCSRPPRRLPAAEEEPDDEDIVATALSWATVAEVRRQDVTRWAQQVRSTCRREAWDNVKLGRELSDPRAFNRRKIHRHCCLSIWIADRSIKTIA